MKEEEEENELLCYVNCELWMDLGSCRLGLGSVWNGAAAIYHLISSSTGRRRTLSSCFTTSLIQLGHDREPNVSWQKL